MKKGKVSTQVTTAREYSRMIVMNAERHNQRTGQYLFNSLPKEVGVHVTETSFDPFHRNMSQYQIEEWLNRHIIFSESGELIVGLFDNNKMIWERHG